MGIRSYKMKKIVFLLLSMLIIVNVLIFAGGEQESDDVVELRFNLGVDPARFAYYVTAVEQFELENPDIDVVLENTPWVEYWSKLQTLTAGKKMPDVWNYVPGFGQEWLENDLLLPLNDLIDADPDMDIDDFASGMLDYMTKDGKLYGFPYDVSGSLLYYNKDLLDMAGVAYPDETWTFADLRKASEQVVSNIEAINNQSVYGLGNYMPAGWEMAGYLQSWGGDYITPDLNVLIDSPESKEAMNYFIEMAEDGLLPSLEEAGVIGSPSFLAWLQGRTGFLIDGPWHIPTYLESCSFEWDIAPVPIGPVKRSPSLLGGTFVIDKSTKYPEESYRLLTFITSEEQLENIVAKTGAGIPGRLSASDQMNPVMKKAAVFISKYNKPFYPIQGSFSIFERAKTELESLYLGQKSVDETMDSIAEYASEIIDENY